MAAITFKFGDQTQITPIDSASALIPREQLVRVVLRRRQGLADYDERLPEGMVSELANQAVEQSHAGLEHMVWLRKVVEEALIGNKITVAYEGRDVLLYLEEPLPNVPAWNPPASKNVTKFSLLSWTSKMGTPSFSLPAGATAMGGSCPGANAGQTTTTKADAAALAPLISKKIGGWPVRLAQAICQRCLAGDTRVLVRGRGLVRLDEIGEGEIEVFSGNEWRTTRLIAQGIREVVVLRTTWGHEITLTPDHKVLTDDGMVEVQDLDVGAVLTTGSEPRVWSPETKQYEISSPFPMRASLPVFDLGAQHGNALETSYPTEWSADLGYTLGALLGDGTIHYREHPTVSIVSHADDRAVPDRVSAAIRSWCATESDTTIGSDGLAHAYWRVKSLVRFFDTLGFDKRPEVSARRAPALIWTASRDGVCGFLQGLFDTDGSVSVNDAKLEVSLASVSRGLLRDVQLLLGAFGVNATICAYATSNKTREADGHNALYKLSIGGIDSLRLFAETLGFRLARKQEKLAQGLAARATVAGRTTQPRVVSVTRLRAYQPVFDLVNVGPERRFVANGIVVSNCYAEGGQYATGLVQFAQLVRYAWTKEAVANGTFVPVMSWAVQNANYHLDGKGTVEVVQQTEDGRIVEREIHPPVERDGKKYFRIHDSGDWYDVNYLRAWQEVARLNPDVTFWAPSRVWMLPKLDRAMEDNPSNLIVRPSAYHINEPPPREMGKGWAAGSTSYKDVLKPPGIRPRGDKLPPGVEGPTKPYDWDCQAYNTESENVTCREALAPDGEVGCRACWKNKQDEINYTLH